MKINLQLTITISAIFLAGVVFNSCQKEEEAPDPCAAISCVNGGFCVNGECDCPDGYSGPDCGNEDTPTSMRISNITVTKFPSTDGGAGWDLTSGPDIYVQVVYNNSTIYDHPSFYQNADPNLEYDFEPSTNLNFDNTTNSYAIILYDYDDLDADDFMGGIEFTPYQRGNNFPTTITLDAGGDVAFELTVSYTW